MWKIETPSVTDPVVREVHRILSSHLMVGAPFHPSATRQWYDDFRTLRFLLGVPRPVRVRSFSSLDCTLQQRHCGEQVDKTVREGGTQWHSSASGFLHPWRVTDRGIRDKTRDPVAVAAEIHVIGTVLASDDVESTIQKVFDVPYPRDLASSGDHGLPRYLLRASASLDHLLQTVLSLSSADELRERRALMASLRMQRTSTVKQDRQ
ncbi:hypothetical protein [Streptomyces beijiangensis]|uniref:hypothetical protein n=1 Tax=Streptomyces beijiangensis TaxID=163361 RepID=UPI001F5D24E6|nr:hypothetical protein [Streptomyces beijiangensis]